VGLFDWFRPRTRIEPLENANVANSSGRRAIPAPFGSLPRFQESASDVGRSSSTIPTRLKMRTAFTPSRPVTEPSMFAGRRVVLRSLIRAIEDQRLHVVIYGDRGIGKTSTVHVLSHLAREARYLVRYTSCSENSDFSEIFRAIANDIPLIYHTDTDPTSTSAETDGVLADLLPPGPVSVSQMAELMAKLTGIRVLIILDEFDRSESVKFRRSISELIKSLSDRSTRVQLVIAGVAANLTELIQHIPSIRRNIIGLPMPNMEADEVDELVRIGAATCDLAYNPETRNEISSLANGSPYLASLLSQHAGVAALDRGGTSVEPQDVSVAVSQALEEVEGRISPSMRHLIRNVIGRQQRIHLMEMATEALNHIGYIRRDGHGGIASYDRTLVFKQLSGPGGVIEPIPDDPDGAYRFVEDGVALYLWLIAATAKRIGDSGPS
jgi:Cdc6-like AAA superfamily ATPase